MAKSPSIRAIFERDIEGNYTEDALLYQYILKYCKNDDKPDNEIAIRPWDLTGWLVDNYPEYRNHYKGSRFRRSKKIENTLPRVKRKLEDLNSLFLLEESTDKAQKVDAPLIIYRFTKSGHFLAWLIETESTDRQKRDIAIRKVYNILISYLTDKRTSRSLFLYKFFQQCKQIGTFISNASDFLTSYEQVRPIYDEVALLELFLDVPRALYWIFAYPGLFIATLDQLDEETKKTLLFQFKLEIEGYYDIYLSNKEWEIMRYRNIGNYSAVTIPGYCNKCEEETAFQYDILEYFRSMYERDLIHRELSQPTVLNAVAIIVSVAELCWLVGMS
ncbi:MAG: hypothetical protein M3297_06390 [Thermoproteota archaeon]|nr:hypothetical protein [Thermoproteota archaeon]